MEIKKSEVLITISDKASFVRKILAFTGPGLLVAVGYMDPGNWATDLQGGAKFGYTLLFIILLSNLFAIVLQHLALKLGIVTQYDLAQACKAYFNRPTSFFLWILAEIAIAATDLAEIVGTAIALNLLFGLPLLWGVAITVLDVLVLLVLENKNSRILESIIGCFILIIVACFVTELFLSKPIFTEIAKGLLPHAIIFTNKEALLIAVGIIGATVMPHNLYLHSHIAKKRQVIDTPDTKQATIHLATIDSTVSLLIAFFINASILILAASSFHTTGHQGVAKIEEAYTLLIPLLGGTAATLFAIALLASGQNSTITGTLAGQIVMEGFLNIRLKPWIRRIITRLIAIVPAVLILTLYGQDKTDLMLVGSQIILSLQLPFAIIPLVYITSKKSIMGKYVNSTTLTAIAWVITSIILCFDFLAIYFLIQG